MFQTLKEIIKKYCKLIIAYFYDKFKYSINVKKVDKKNSNIKIRDNMN